MKIRTLFSMAAALMLVACSNDEELELLSHEVILGATVEGNSSSTRAGFDEKGKFFWSDGDELGVTSTMDAEGFYSLELQTGSGTGSGTFAGRMPGDYGEYAVYPASTSGSHRMNGTKLNYNFPTNYAYAKVDKDFFTENEGEGNSFNPAMWGKVIDRNVQLKHLGGVFCIKIPKMPCEKGALQLEASQKINGDFQVDLSEDTPVINTTTSSSDYDKKVTITFGGAELNKPGVFYVPVPVGTYEVRVMVTDDSGAEQINTPAGSFSIKRRDLKRIEFNNASIDATPCSLKDVDKGLVESDALVISDKISDDVTITIPRLSNNNTSQIKTRASSQPSTQKSLSFLDIAESASLTIKESNDSNDSGDETYSVDSLTLSIPNNETEKFEHLKVDINMPNSTVVLDANTGSATYYSVSVSTNEGDINNKKSKYSVIIRKDVTVENLSVEPGGYVLVETGAVLKKFTNTNSDKGFVYIDYEPKASIPDVISDKGNGAVAEEKYNQEPDLEDMSYVFRHGGTYTMQHDLDISNRGFYVPKSRKAILDLNGYTLTAGNSEESSIDVLGSLTLADSKGGGKIIAGYDYSKDKYNTGLIYVLSGGKFTMTGGTIYAVRDDAETNGQYGIRVSGTGTVDIQGGKIEAGWYAVYDKDKYPEKASQITISGGELISSAGYVFNLPQSGSTIITGGAFQGAKGLVESKGEDHTITITGGKFINVDPRNYVVGSEIIKDETEGAMIYIVVSSEQIPSDQNTTSE